MATYGLDDCDRTDFLKRLVAYRKQNPDQRYGQAVFNLLYRIDPDIADKVRGGSMDPFYNNDRVKPLLDSIFDQEG